VHLSDQSRATFVCRPNLPLCWNVAYSIYRHRRIPRRTVPALNKFLRVSEGSAE
jgi:hypothetical protein